MATASDNFNRANESPLAGNWTGYGGGGTNNRFTLTSNVAAAANTTTDDCSAYWNANTFGNDQFSQADVTVSGTGGGGQGIGVILRTDGAANVGGVGKYTQYRIVADHAASSNVEVAKFITGSYTMLTRYTKSFTNGATLSAQVSGTTITTVFVGATLGSVTDSSVTTGHPGIGFSSNETSASLDNWSGGDLGGAIDAISGTINATSALSGSLVRIRPLSGTINATSALSGAVGRIRLIAGTFNATSNLSGAVVRIRQIVGTINATSSLSGDIVKLGATKAISGTINATSALSGALARIRPLAGTVNATSALSGTLVALRAIAGSFNMTSSLSGSLVAQRAIKGTINATSTLAGAVSLVGQTATQFISNHFPIIQMFQKKR